MGEIRVRYQGGDRFGISIRDHHLVVDQPPDAGGEDTGPTPTELFVAGLASCVGFYAERFLRRHGLSAEGLAVRCRFHMAERPARVGSVEIAVETAAALSSSQRRAMEAVVDHCTVHNSLQKPPEVRISLAAGRQAA